MFDRCLTIVTQQLAGRVAVANGQHVEPEPEREFIICSLDVISGETTTVRYVIIGEISTVSDSISGEISTVSYVIIGEISTVSYVIIGEISTVSDSISGEMSRVSCGISWPECEGIGRRLFIAYSSLLLVLCHLSSISKPVICRMRLVAVSTAMLHGQILSWATNAANFRKTDNICCIFHRA